MARGQIPLEWKTDVVTITAEDTPTNGEFDLDLLPDEIAEIHIIDSIIEASVVVDDDNAQNEFRMYVSMDPDAIASPFTNNNLLDLEVFFFNLLRADLEVGAAGTSWQRNQAHKMIKMPEKYPLLVGTNFSQVCEHQSSDEAVTSEYITTVYFKRRRATASELNQILLKRR